MKTLFSLLFLFFAFGTSAQAEIRESLVCTTEGRQNLYDTSGEIHIAAEVVNPLLLRNVVLTTDSDRLGLRAPDIKGVSRGKWARFDLGSDSLCNYKLVLPKDFSNRRLAPGYLDTRCQVSLIYNISLNCQIR